MGSNGIFVTLMVLQRDTNTFCFSSSPENINTDTTLSPQMSQPTGTGCCPKRGAEHCVYISWSITLPSRQGPKTPVASSLVWSVKPHEIYSPILFAPGIHVEGFFFTCRHVSSWVIIFCCKVTHENYQSILREFPNCSALTLFVFWRRCYRPLSLPCAPLTTMRFLSYLVVEILVNSHVGICVFALNSI